MPKLIAICLVALISACATKPTSYDSHASFAMNIARAGHIDAKLRDMELPKDTVTSITDSAGFGFGLAASGYNAPIPGLSPSEMAGLNFAAWLFGPTPDSARNSFMAWIPKSIAGGNPKDKLADILLDAASKAAIEMGFTPQQSIARGGTDKSGVAVYFRDGNNSSCVNNDKYSNCWIGFAIRDSYEVEHPPAFVGTAETAHFFDPSNKVYSRFTFPKDIPGFNEFEALVATSKYTPKWIYFYSAPKKLFVGSNQPIKIPMIIHQGKVHYFITPNSD